MKIPTNTHTAAVITKPVADDNEFLALLEQNLGRRWPKEWRARVWNMMPTPKNLRIRGTCDPGLQLAAVNRIRAYRVQQAIKRLSGTEPCSICGETRVDPGGLGYCRKCGTDIPV